jgi:hypothetical protein
MYLLLLVFGAVIGAAGVVLAVSGVSLRDGTFDAATLTPGIVAVLGGVLLIALGVGLRTLKRIEQALASRPMPRIVDTSDNPKSPEVNDASAEPAPVAFASEATRESQPGAVAQEANEAESKSPAPDNYKASSAAPTIALSALEANANGDAQRAAKAGNGTAGLRSLRLSTPGRSATPNERQSGPAFDALWPKGPRPSRVAQATPTATQTPGAEPVQPQQNAGQTTAAASHANTVTSHANDGGATSDVSILKSGVVNGMPYTLYSDGSIEAQLPEGTLRFGSITELRNHIEQSA